MKASCTFHVLGRTMKKGTSSSLALLRSASRMSSTHVMHQQQIPSDPKAHAALLSSKAMQDYEQGRYAPMVENLQEAIKLAPDERAYYAQLANGLIRLNKISDAARALGTRASIIDNEQALGHFSSGQKQIEGGNYHSALDCLNSAVALKPTSSTFLRERAAVHFRMDAFAAGVRDYVDAVFHEHTTKTAL